jgi:hypothetical protein
VLGAGDDDAGEVAAGDLRQRRAEQTQSPAVSGFMAAV